MLITYVITMVQNYLATLDIDLNREEGQGMAEYGLILAGIAVIVMVAVFALGPIISDQFDAIAGKIAP